MNLLEGMGFIEIDSNCQRNVNAALMLVHRLLNCLDYKCKKKGMQNYRLRNENIRLHDEHIQFMKVVEENETRYVVYMDKNTPNRIIINTKIPSLTQTTSRTLKPRPHTRADDTDSLQLSSMRKRPYLRTTTQIHQRLI